MVLLHIITFTPFTALQAIHVPEEILIFKTENVYQCISENVYVNDLRPVYFICNLVHLLKTAFQRTKQKS